MGRRKSKRTQFANRFAPTKPLDKSFNCPFCKSTGSCSVKMDWLQKVGVIKCSSCDEDFATAINNLTEPLDIYNEWIDACEEVN